MLFFTSMDGGGPRQKGLDKIYRSSEEESVCEVKVEVEGAQVSEELWNIMESIKLASKPFRFWIQICERRTI